MTDNVMTPVPAHALSVLWHAIDDAREDMQRARTIELANHPYDPYCVCDHCPDVEDINRKVGQLMAHAAQEFREACEEVQVQRSSTTPMLFKRAVMS